ncbi:cyclin-I isoform X2 [Genypterus blacodes]|uniref:cyclin-I isoform X2 n=1 Tax=Genypterus blacodes TaxID=154954 RepID=UPI003F76C533
MKFTEPWERQRLSFLLEKAASREAKMWKVYVPKKPSGQDTDVSPAQRDEAVQWLTELHSRLQLYPESLVLAVSILDRFLASIKARPKYLRCIAIACFFLAAKTWEEDECVPPLRDLVGSSSCGCSPSDILRMERIILDKLNWDLHTATSLDFLHIFHALVLSCRSGPLDSVLGMSRSQHLSLLTRRLYHCLADHTLIQLQGSLLALALITLELETCCPDWLHLTIELLGKAQINSSELIRCRELVACSLSTSRASLPPNTVYIYQPLLSETTKPPAACEPPDPCSLVAATAQPRTPAAGEEQTWVSASSSRSILALLSPPELLHHRHQLHRVTLSCKGSTKRKVEEMEVDNFFDGIKRLYNEETNATTIVQEGSRPTTTGEGTEGGAGRGGLTIGSILLSRQDGSSSPCPPLQPVIAP